MTGLRSPFPLTLPIGTYDWSVCQPPWMGKPCEKGTTKVSSTGLGNEFTALLGAIKTVSHDCDIDPARGLTCSQEVAHYAPNGGTGFLWVYTVSGYTSFDDVYSH